MSDCARPVLHAAVWDDDAAERAQLERALQKWSEENEQALVIRSCAQMEELEEILLTPFYLDAVFLDIMTPEASRAGLTLAKRLRSRGFTGGIVFVSSSPRFGLEGYEADALAYLLKPVQPARLDACMKRICRQRLADGPTITLGSGRNTVRFRTDEIVAFRSALNYVHVATTSGEFRVRGTLSGLMPILPPSFVRCRRTDVVNLAFVRAVQGSSILLTNGTAVPLTSSYAADFQRRFLEHCF
ncbi:MAG: response regulator transcription factor [Clostridia bacterium]|nr:response regulator transcription factor [Clostridia bacterium]